MKTRTLHCPRRLPQLFRGFYLLTTIVSCLILFPVIAHCTPVSLAWDANSESDLAGYILYYGTSSGNYTNSIDVGNNIEYTTPDLQDGVTYYFAVTAYNLDDIESNYSQELPYTVGVQNSSPATPAAPNSPSSGYIDTSYTFDTSASDPDGDPLEFKFDWGDGTESSWGAASRSYAWSSAGTFCIKTRARDSHGAISGWSNCHNITIATPTYSITASAGANGSISPSATVAADHGSDQTFTITANQNYQVLAVLVDGSSRGAITSYTFENVSQNHTISASFVSINQAPIADAGSDQTVSEGAMVTLNGLNSTDPGGSIVSYTWQQTDGLTVQLSNSGSNTATFSAPSVSIAGETLTFRLTVTDDGGLTDVDTCIVEVTQDVVVDSDGDGVPDAQDDFPYDADEYLDTDGDGEGNNADTDDDNDSMPDEWELAYGLNPLLDDAGGDPDGDEVSNINEFNLGTAPDFNEGNFKPDTPVLLTPEIGATVSLTPQFETEDFDDPNVNDVHSKTQWVIIRAFDDVCVFDVTSTASLLSLTLPKQILEENTEYIWKARFIDNHDTPSEWSEEKEFVTGLADHDRDKNGVPDVQEVTETLDLDADATADLVQSDIKCASVQDGDDEVQICISIKDAENAQSIVSLEVDDPTDPNLNSATEGKPNYFEFGLLNFKLLVTNPGDETTVTIYLSKSAFNKGNCFKYDSVDGIWLDYSGYTDFSPNRKEVYLTLKDGGFGDADGIENGIIVDPLAFGSESDPSGGNSDGSPIDKVLDGIIPDDLSCFISVAADGSTARQPWSLWREIRGRELAIIFVLMILVSAAKVLFSRIKQNRRLLCKRDGFDFI
ncbi:hypothetical protein D1BOALGB6SA_3061 [Olavius sp. associated proteobacterium Delta 1]|nr:hypothetical protein D1BOALGB6SA_3061 [Olavius sp. associated proteobacterium Delta 1]